MPGPDLRGLPSWLLRAPHGEAGTGGGLGEGRLGTPAAGADGRGRRRLCGWTLRCSTALLRRLPSRAQASLQKVGVGPCSTCPSGSCASSPAPCPSQRCCAGLGRLFLSGRRGRPGGLAGGAAQARKVEVPVFTSCPTTTADPDLGPGCWGVLRVVAVSHVSPVGGTAAPATISEITTGRAQHPFGEGWSQGGFPKVDGAGAGETTAVAQLGDWALWGTADVEPLGPHCECALRGQARLWEPRPLE